MARNSNQNWFYPTPLERPIGRRPLLASEGGPAGRPTGKRRDTKSKRRARRQARRR